MALLGEEMMINEGNFIARRVVLVVRWHYSAMSYCFALPLLLILLPHAKKVFAKLAYICDAYVERPEAIKTKGTSTSADDMQESLLDIEHQFNLSFEEVNQKMDKARREAAKLLSRRERSRTKV